MPNRLARGNQPLSAAARRQPRRLVPVGRGGARARRRAEDKPILLSVGYSACHWCHVMAHESFEDPAIAEVMNALLREHQGRPRGAPRHRPDLPGRARDAHAARRRLAAHRCSSRRTRCRSSAARTSRRRARYGMPGLSGPAPERVAPLLPTSTSDDIARRTSDRGRARAHAPGRRRARRSALRASARSRPRSERCKQSFDAEHGGFGGAPKFPHPTDLELAAAPLRRDRRQAGAARRGVHARAHGRGRHLRPARRRLRRYSVDATLDDPALREDALRQRLAAAALRRGAGRRRASRSSRASARRPRSG